MVRVARSVGTGLRTGSMSGKVMKRLLGLESDEVVLKSTMLFSESQERSLEENNERIVELFSGTSNCEPASWKRETRSVPIVAFVYIVCPSLTLKLEQPVAGAISQ